MSWVTDAINDGISDILSGGAASMLFELVESSNSVVTNTSAKLGDAPNAGIMALMKSINENVAMPIAAVMLTYIMTYELITMITEKNHGNEVGTWVLFKWIFKTAVLVMLCKHSWEISNAFFETGGWIATKANTVIGSKIVNPSVSAPTELEMKNWLKATYNVGQLLKILLISFIDWLITLISAVLCQVVVIVRLFEIAIYVSCASIPAASFGNRDWKSIGENYTKGLAGIGMQSFFIMVALGMYSVMVGSAVSIAAGTNILKGLEKLILYGIAMTIVIWNSKKIAFAIVDAH
ncbi:MAG: hypothetical protein J6O61_11490 [Butyrivibrio sp.]|jgi:hypothetical protein|uniref:VirB6/TrbL-like conjugal transfer protein, CD1112 family n=1 Tax=Butyrivibrio sp. TaxID=28121 RepID=UPI001B170578|nr:CD0415/CD1112 family protein [Butyrivibrio sp.]MBO6241437.1 hypothetical protein [Butyrivibrio sp.]